MGLYIVMIGVQGAGKGTQAAMLAESFGIPHVSTGDLFRAMQDQDTPLAREVQALMQAGNLIPDEITNRMVEERLKETDAQAGVILDGYPRNVWQAQALDKMLQAQGEKITLAAVMELHDEIAVMRAEGRRFSPDKERVYNIYFRQPLNKKDGVWLDDVTGKPLIQRDDDQRDAIEQRISLYHEKTAPMIAYYEQKGVVVRINANQSIEAVQASLVAAIEDKKA